MPLHSDQSLCRRVQGREHVCTEHRGHVYLGVLVRQIVQREERRGSAIGAIEAEGCRGVVNMGWIVRNVYLAVDRDID